MLSDVASINPRLDDIPAQTRVSFVGMAELDSLAASALPRETRTFAEVSRGYTVFRDRDILAAKITPCWENGKVGQALLEHAVGVGSTEFHVIRPGEGLDARYLLHFLRQPQVKIAGQVRMTGSGGQKRVPASFLKNLLVPLPPLSEQRRIAAILERADSIRAKRRQVLAQLDSLAQSVFCELFGHVAERASLRELGVDFASGKNVLGDDLDSHPDNRVIKVSAISSGIFLEEETKPMPRGYTPPESHLIRKNDILFGRASGSLDLLGATAVVETEPKNLYLPDKVWRLTTRPGARVEAPYVLGVLRSSDARAYIRHNASGAAGVRNISKARMLEYRAPVPPVHLQREFAVRMAQIHANRTSAQRARTLDDELFASLQSRAFRGQL